MSRAQLALPVPDLDASVVFCSKLPGTEPAGLRDGHADFARSEPPLELTCCSGPGPADADADAKEAATASRCC